MIKIRFFSNYADSRSLLGHYYMTSMQNHDTRFDYTLDEDYDVAVIFNRTDLAIRRDAFRIVMIQEPSWSPGLVNSSFLEDNDLLFIHDASLFPKARNVIEHPTIINYYDELPLDFLLGNKYEKKKKLSIILSNTNFCIGHEKRLTLLQKILDSDLNIDIYGRGHRIKDKRYKGDVSYKYHGLVDYEYSICLENSRERNYVTEKFIDAVMCNTFPIYMGAPNISEVYLSGGFHSIDIDDDQIINKLRDIIDSTSNNQIYYNDLNKKRYLNCYNIHSVLSAIL